MGMARVNFEIPEEILFSLNENISEFVGQMRLFTALHLFKSHKLSLGKSAELAGIDKHHFTLEMDKYNIPLIDYDANELEKELEQFDQ